MFGKNKASPKVESAVAKAVNFELTIADMARRSERRAWLVAWCSIAMALVLAGGYFYMLPMKEKVPYLVMADAYSGNATVARLQGDFENNSITSREAVNRSNVARFVTARESYDIALMTLQDWATVYTMSTPEVASGYTSLHSRKNPSSPYNQYGPNRSIRVRILSIVFDGGGNGMPPKGATVRFQRNIYDKATGTSRPLDSKIATLAFTYKANLKMSEKDRVQNPLGFRVTAYRVDNDYAPMPALEAEAAPVPQQAPAAAPQVPVQMAEGMPPEPDPALFGADAAAPAASPSGPVPPATGAQPTPQPSPAQPAVPAVPQR